MIADGEQVRRALKGCTAKRLPLEGMRPAAVLIPFFFKNQSPHLLFTRRSDDLEHHSGEISFPGGMVEPEDQDLSVTALRETEEEMGIAPEDVQLLGELDDFVSIHGYRVTPFVGIYSWPYPYRVATEEIAEILEVPLGHFLNPDIHRKEDWRHKGRTYPIHFYRYENQDIWGLTAAILRQFIKRITTA